jgi:predicted dehydrogenase
VGAQALGDVVLRKLKELVDAKAIGDVVSSNWIGHAPISTAQGWPANLTVFIDNESASSRISIVFGHGKSPTPHFPRLSFRNHGILPRDALPDLLFAAVSIITSVLGDFNQVQSVFKTQDKTAPLLDDKGTVTDPSYKVTAPDNVLVQGILQDGGIASLAIRFSAAPVSDVGYRWIISGTKGEIELVDSKPGWFHQGLPLEDTKIYLRKQGEEKTEEVKIALDGEPAYLKELPAHVVNTARLYESFAKGDTNGYAEVHDTLKVQKLLEKINKNAVWAP